MQPRYVEFTFSQVPLMCFHVVNFTLPKCIVAIVSTHHVNFSCHLHCASANFSTIHWQHKAPEVNRWIISLHTDLRFNSLALTTNDVNMCFRGNHDVTSSRNCGRRKKLPFVVYWVIHFKWVAMGTINHTSCVWITKRGIFILNKSLKKTLFPRAPCGRNPVSVLRKLEWFMRDCVYQIIFLQLLSYFSYPKVAVRQVRNFWR